MSFVEITSNFEKIHQFFLSWKSKACEHYTDPPVFKLPRPFLRSATESEINSVSTNPNYETLEKRRRSHYDSRSLREEDISFKPNSLTLLSNKHRYLSSSCQNLTDPNKTTKYYKRKSRKSIFRRCSMFSDTTDEENRLQTPRYSIDTLYRGHVNRISEAISSQHIIIYQISKAISHCRSNPKYLGSKAHIEAEKILLLANIRKSILNSKISKDTSQENLSIQNTVTHKIKSLIFTEDINNLPRTNTLMFYVCLIICEEEVISSEVVSSECGQVIFGSPIVLSYIPLGYDIKINIYGMAVKVPSSRIIKCLNNVYYTVRKSISSCFKRTPEEEDYGLESCTSAFKLLGTSSLHLPYISKQKELQLVQQKSSFICRDFTASLESVYNYSTL